MNASDASNVQATENTTSHTASSGIVFVNCRSLTMATKRFLPWRANDDRLVPEYNVDSILVLQTCGFEISGEGETQEADPLLNGPSGLIVRLYGQNSG